MPFPAATAEAPTGALPDSVPLPPSAGHAAFYAALASAPSWAAVFAAAIPHGIRLTLEIGTLGGDFEPPEPRARAEPPVPAFWSRARGPAPEPRAKEVAPVPRARAAEGPESASEESKELDGAPVVEAGTTTVEPAAEALSLAALTSAVADLKLQLAQSQKELADVRGAVEVEAQLPDLARSVFSMEVSHTTMAVEFLDASEEAIRRKDYDELPAMLSKAEMHLKHAERAPLGLAERQRLKAAKNRCESLWQQTVKQIAPAEAAEKHTQRKAALRAEPDEQKSESHEAQQEDLNALLAELYAS